MFTRKFRLVALLILCVMLVQMLASCSLAVGPRPEAQPLDRDPYATLDKYKFKIGNACWKMAPRPMLSLMFIWKSISNSHA